MSLYGVAEDRLLKKTFGEVGLPLVIVNWGFRVGLFKPEQSVFRDVYGNSAGDEGYSAVGEIDIVVVGDGFVPIDREKAGALTEGWIYTTSPDLAPGDRVEIVREDGRARRFKVEEDHGLGMTTVVFKRFRILAVGD